MQGMEQPAQRFPSVADYRIYIMILKEYPGSLVHSVGTHLY